MGEKDIAQKNLEAYNDVFADIVNGSLFGGRKVVSDDRLVDAKANSQYKADTDVLHEQERDVAKYWLDGKCKVRLALLGIENQIAIDKNMPLRVLSYDGAAYRDAMNQYDIIEDEATGRKVKISKPCYPVITIVLYFGKAPWKTPLSLYEAIDIQEQLKPFVNDYKINLIDVPRLQQGQVEQYTSDFQILADYFVKVASKQKYVPSTKKIRHIDEFLKLMSVLTGDNRYAEVGQDFAAEEEATDMCTVLDEVEARGEARGINKGTINLLKSICKLHNWTIEQAMEFSGIPRKDFAKYMAML